MPGREQSLTPSSPGPDQGPRGISGTLSPSYECFALASNSLPSSLSSGSRVAPTRALTREETEALRGPQDSRQKRHQPQCAPCSREPGLQAETIGLCRGELPGTGGV